MKLYNTSPDRTVTHEDNGIVYRIEPKTMQDVPDGIAGQMLTAWPILTSGGPAADNKATVPWELSTGPVFERAAAEHKIDISKVTKTNGPDRPPVEEDPIPADAIDTETGKVDESKLNTHLCTYCQETFPTVGKLRKHMKQEHNV